MLDAADDLAAIGQDDCGGVALERGAEGIIRGEEKPGIAAGLHQCLPGGMGKHVGVVGPVHGIRRALRVGEIGGRGAGIDVDAVLFLDDVVDGERDAGIRHVPLPRDRGADIGLVLVIAGDDIDLPALGGQTGILSRHLGGQRRARPGEVGVQPRLIRQCTDLDGLVLRDRKICRGEAERGPQQQRNDNSGFHYWASSLDSLVILQTPFFRRRDRCGACPCWLAAPS